MRFLHRRPAQTVGRLAGFLAGVCTAQLVLWVAMGPGGRQPLPTARCEKTTGTAVETTELAITTAAASKATGTRPRIFCLILTHPQQYETLAVRVNNTWARKCDKYYFVGSEPANVSIPVLELPVVESRRVLWQKVRMSLEAVHARERLQDFDFFLKADDDTFVVMENLRGLLRGRDPDAAAIFGRRFAYQGNREQQYMSGGAGYVLSRQALRQLVTQGFGTTRTRGMDYCNVDVITVEDYLMGRCLGQIGVKFEDSLDDLGRERFHPLRPETMTNPGFGPDWIHQYNYHPFKKCVTCISNTSISFHYVENVLEVQFLLYTIRVAK